MKNNVQIKSDFFNFYRKLIVEEVLPYQWEVMNNKDVEMTHEPGGNEESLTHSFAIENFEIAAGMKNGEHHGYTFQDTDVYKWLEAAAYTLKYNSDSKLKNITENVIDLIEQAQEEDGYLVTYFQIKAQDRKFSRLKQSHELYTMGHFIEAAVAYYDNTQNIKALNIAQKMADCILDNFGEEPGKIDGSDGHPEIELALARLYELTKEEKYLKLGEFFLLTRGKDSFFDQQINDDGIDRDVIDGMSGFPLSYYQAHKPLLEQTTAEGHAVRMVYLCTGLAKVARLSNNDKFFTICQNLWNNIIEKKMYITGAIGSTNIGESFTGEYDLPNDTMYGETCASVAMVFFANEMLQIDPHGKYADIIEKELFNGIISGISLDGTHFFYVNPLEADPQTSRSNPSKEHVLTSRAEWFGCACCPSNLARIIASIDKYVYTIKDNIIYSHQFIANDTSFENGLQVSQISNLPWDSNVKYKISNNSNLNIKFAIRIPEWSTNYKMVIDGKETNYKSCNQFIFLDILPGQCVIDLSLDMSIKLYKSNSNIRFNIGKVALQRGPLVYCMEKIDNGDDVWKYCLSKDSTFEYEYDEKKLGGIGVITATGKKITSNGDSLYYVSNDKHLENCNLIFVPYYSWANRGESQMQVWINYND